ncbi:hypothetical protein QJS66_20850 [Kocuria rhizophila]|nr:hypothetical protein QJS66_20850 [Kocuria rhizophila]
MMVGPRTYRSRTDAEARGLLPPHSRGPSPARRPPPYDASASLALNKSLR